MSGSTYCPSAHAESEKRCIKMSGFQHLVLPAHVERRKKCNVKVLNIFSLVKKNVRFWTHFPWWKNVMQGFKHIFLGEKKCKVLNTFSPRTHSEKNVKRQFFFSTLFLANNLANKKLNNSTLDPQRRNWENETPSPVIHQRKPTETDYTYLTE